MYDLTGFQRDCLRGIAILENPHGLGLKQWLEDEAAYGRDNVHHGRLYPNLDKLANKGLINKDQYDDRTNRYTLTQRGLREIEDHADQWTEAVEQGRERIKDSHHNP